MTPDRACVTVCFVTLSRTTVSWLTEEPPSDEPAWNGRRFRQQRQRAAVSTVDVLLFYYCRLYVVSVVLAPAAAQTPAVRTMDASRATAECRMEPLNPGRSRLSS
ncbi:hypothetical protein MTO96_004685 [Rhipicephalus appendiculatus]